MKKNLFNINTLNKEIRDRKQQYSFKDIPLESTKMKEELIREGWTVNKTMKKTIRLQFSKDSSELLCNRIWILFYRMGFSQLNKEYSVEYNFESNNFRFDIVASDYETIIAVCCFNNSFEEHAVYNVIKKIRENRARLVRQLRDEVSLESKVRFAFYFSDCDNSQLLDDVLSADIYIFDNKKILYYEQLSGHLKSASKYQLLGNLFHGQKVSELDNRVPAIEGKMGGHIYYSFSIEPQKLLKFSYVLHRDDSQVDSMPTYQRIIKKSRLQQIEAFVNSGGYFPNSIIVSIDSPNVNFEAMPIRSKKGNKFLTRAGVLSLPQKYKSVYIIDGQHRLYGYSDSSYATTNTIPVVAFVNLRKSDQVKLFMEINENQKPVSKNLRNTLNADLLWDSDKINEQYESLCIRVAMKLGEDSNSKLYNRIVIGENSEDDVRCITIDFVRRELMNSRLIPTYDNKNNLKNRGILEGKEIKENTFDNIYSYLEYSFNYIAKNLIEDWDLGKKGSLSINVAIGAFIRIFSDIAEKVYNDTPHIFIDQNMRKIFEETNVYLGILVKYLTSLNHEKKVELKTSYGGGGVTKYWRHLQLAISKEISSFEPLGMDKYFEDNNTENNTKGYKLVAELERFLKNDIKNELIKTYGNEWLSKALPKNVYTSINLLASEKNFQKNSNEHVLPWDCTYITQLRDIVLYQNHWGQIFEKKYSKQDASKKRDKKSNTKWMVKLNNIRNNVAHNKNISFDDLQFLEELVAWLIGE